MLQSRDDLMVLFDFIICVLLAVVTSFLVAGVILVLAHAAEAPELPSRSLALGAGLVTGLLYGRSLIQEFRAIHGSLFRRQG